MLSSYTAILEEVRLALTEVDRHRLPGRAPRLDWAIRDMQGSRNLRIVLTPNRIPPRRLPETVPWSSQGLVAGIAELEKRPAIPEWFSEQTVQRVQRVGAQMERGQLDSVEIASLNGQRHESIIDSNTIEKAQRAVAPATDTWGSVTGRLEELVARKGKHPRAVVYLTSSRRAVVVRASNDQIGQLREAWGREVIAAGQLIRNSVGQPVRLELTELQYVERSGTVSAWHLLGSAPDITGDLSTSAYLDMLRDG
jgi:hypothetical protein